MRRIVTAREQAEMLSPWHARVAAPKQFDIWDSGDLDSDRPKKEKVVKEKVKAPPQPKPQPATPERQLDMPYWMGNDWRTGDGGAFRSDIRPQIPEVDLPHPADYLAPEEWEKRKSQLKDPVYDPHGVLPDHINFEDLVQGEMTHLRNLSPEDAVDGRWWYPGAHDISKNAADLTTGDHPRTVAEWSAFSPKNEWDNNIENGLQFSLNYPGRAGRPYEETKELHGDPDLVAPPSQRKKPGYDESNYDGPVVFPMPAMTVSDAQSIRHAPGNSFMKFLTGPKRQAFFQNIMDKSKMREPRADHDPVEDSGYYEMPTIPYTGEPDWRMHPQQLSTMDTQHVRMTHTPHGSASDQELADLEYKTPPYFSAKRIIDDGTGKKVYDAGYELQHRAHWEALRRHNAEQQDVHKHIIPMQAQAGPWLKFRKDINGALERIRGQIPREPGQLPKGVKPGRWPSQRGRGLDMAEGPLSEDQEEYDRSGRQAPTQDSAKGHHFPRYQKDYSYEGDPDYSVPPEMSGDPRYLELADRYDDERPQKKLPGGKRRVKPGTGWRATERDPRNEVHDLRTVRNKDRRANLEDAMPRFWNKTAEYNNRVDHDRTPVEGECPGSGVRMLWRNFGNRPDSDPYPACAECGRADLDNDWAFRAESH